MPWRGRLNIGLIGLIGLIEPISPIFSKEDTLSISEIIWLAIIGLIVGLIARLLMPGRDPMGLIMTSILGIAGSFVGTFIGRTLLGKGPYYQARWLMSIVGSLVLLFLYRILFARRD
jgi:uncharacterized membrane protein YeaQ/YmgE (transglycosylase-associated protein family)